MSTVTSNVPPLDNKTYTTSAIQNFCQYGNFAASTHNFLECFLFKLPYFLQDIGMGYICIVLCTVVIFTTIFGKIKESYKWFILNQAIWDLLVSYDFICARPSATEWFSVTAIMERIDGTNLWFASKDNVQSSCFYSSEIKLSRFANDIANTEACCMLFLLSFSRFFSLYFHHFYSQFSTPIKSIAAIVIFILFFIASVNLKNTFLVFNTFGNRISQWLSVTEYIILLLIVPVSLIFTVLVLIKIIRQIKFQSYQQSNTQRSANIRIAGVLLFHCITLMILFAFTSVYDFPYNIIPQFRIIIFDIPLRVQMPPFMIKGFKNNQKCINVIRVFIDSIVVLVVLSGYRRSILNVFQKICMPWRKTPLESSTRDTAGVSRNAIADSHR